MRRCDRSWGLVLLFALLTQTVFAQITYQAESAALSAGATIANCSFCSGGRQVQNIGGPGNGTVTFGHVRVSHGGLYPMTVHFNIGDDRAATISANGSTRLDVIFHPAAGPNQDSSQTVLVPLNGGTNSITFNNAHEFAPNLDDIVIGRAPVASFEISGSVKSSAGAPMPGVKVFLSGQSLQIKTVTDAHGDYEFPFLPKGEYYVQPQKPGIFFSPYERYCPVSATPKEGVGSQDFAAKIVWNTKQTGDNF